jgi:hypothetical protein
VIVHADALECAAPVMRDINRGSMLAQALGNQRRRIAFVVDEKDAHGSILKLRLTNAYQPDLAYPTYPTDPTDPTDLTKCYN